jgi:flagellar protein FliJ
MKSRDTLIRLKRFQLEEKRRRVRQIEMMLAEFTRMIGDLDREIANEEKRAGIADPNHFAYPTYARATSVRRDNLKSSIAELLGQNEEAKFAQEEAEAELLKFESLEVRDKTNDRLAEAVARAGCLRVVRCDATLRVSPFLRRPVLFVHFSSTRVLSVLSPLPSALRLEGR